MSEEQDKLKSIDEVPMGKCSECGMPFNKDKSWASQCLLCFKKSKGTPWYKADESFRWAQAQIVALAKHVEAQNSEIACLQFHVAELAKKNAIPPKAAFTDEELKLLLQLCHPDKHANSPKAVAATQLLNAAREKSRQ